MQFTLRRSGCGGSLSRLGKDQTTETSPLPIHSIIIPTPPFPLSPSKSQAIVLWPGPPFEPPDVTLVLGLALAPLPSCFLLLLASHCPRTSLSCLCIAGELAPSLLNILCCLVLHPQQIFSLN